jgi:hypothetical protein
VIFTPARVTSAISASCRIIIWRVYGRIVGMSEATKFSPLPRPTTIGLPPFLAITISSGQVSSTTAIAYEPSSRESEAHRVLERRRALGVDRWEMISVSVSG